MTPDRWYPPSTQNVYDQMEDEIEEIKKKQNKFEKTHRTDIRLPVALMERVKSKNPNLTFSEIVRHALKKDLVLLVLTLEMMSKNHMM